MIRSLSFILVAFALCACTRAPAEGPAAPHLRQQGQAVQLIVDNEPFLILGGELGNSSASSLDYLAPHWETFQALHLNTVLAPVYWELIEPQEGSYDFSSVDGLLRNARAHDMRLVLLWFGSWKNSMSTYAPAWVKRDSARFPRAFSQAGEAQEILSPFSTESRDADARVFAALMAHLRETDGAQHTVLMVQVENEIGMLPSARDHSDGAEQAWAAPVPAALLAQLESRELRPLWQANGARASGSWRELFGASDAAEEIFMAWHFAAYTEHVTAAGKAAYNIPMYVNAALIRPGRTPGQYPSAGPLPHLMTTWRTAAPSIDFLTPDIYFPNFTEWLDHYDRDGNAIFIPEANRAGAAEAGANAFFAFGEHDAMGFSPFSIDSIGANNDLGAAYATLAELSPLILEHQGKGTMAGARAPVAFDGGVDETPRAIVLGDYTLTVTTIDPWTPRPDQNIAAHGGLIIQVGPEDYVIAGSGITVTFAPNGEGRAGIDSAWEGRYVDGAWRPGRLLNGDETHQGRHVRLPPGPWGIQRVRLYRY
ncbi:MAG: DUF5597 domain-containing protein [Terricaulis sp.]